jgi:hypothetical protein
VTNDPQIINGFTYNTLAPGAIVPATYNGSQNTWVYNAATGTITITVNNGSYAYGTTPSPSYTFSCSSGCTSSVLTAGPTFSGLGSNAATYSVSASGAADNNGYTINYVNGTITITKADLTVTANNEQKLMGAHGPALTYTVTGLEDGDTAANVLTGSLTRAQGQSVGAYAINQGTLASDSNYNIIFNSAEFTIAAPIIPGVVEQNMAQYVQSKVNSQSNTQPIALNQNIWTAFPPQLLPEQRLSPSAGGMEPIASNIPQSSQRFLIYCPNDNSCYLM